MRAPKLLATAVVLLATSVISNPARAGSDIHEEILSVYSFQPHLLSSAEIAQKSAVLDKFWSKAQDDPDRYAAGLRDELEQKNAPAFFLFDGSMLLLKLSDTPLDRKIALNAIARCDLRDVQQKDYFFQVHRMASAGENTTAAAFHILEDPDFKVFVPQHVLTLGQDYSLVYMLLPTDPQFWMRPAIDRLTQEKNAKAQRSLLLLLWYAQDDAADHAIHALSQDSSQAEEVRKAARDLEDRSRQLKSSAAKKVSSAKQADLRQRRRNVMAAVSDEALLELDQLTIELMAARAH